MLSISKLEFRIVGFLVRHFSSRFTIRDIASKLSISAPGCHAALKKLERNGFVRAEKLGTGLFYEVSLEKSLARHLVGISLLSYADVSLSLDVNCKTAFSDGKKVIVVSDDDVEEEVRKQVSLEVVVVSVEELKEALADKGSLVSSVFRNSNVLQGEDVVIEVIKELGR